MAMAMAMGVAMGVAYFFCTGVDLSLLGWVRGKGSVDVCGGTCHRRPWGGGWIRGNEGAGIHRDIVVLKFDTSCWRRRVESEIKNLKLLRMKRVHNCDEDIACYTTYTTA